MLTVKDVVQKTVIMCCHDHFILRKRICSYFVALNLEEKVVIIFWRLNVGQFKD